MKKILVTILVVVIGVAIGLGAYFYLTIDKDDNSFTTVKVETNKLEEVLEIESMIYSKEIKDLGFLDGDKVKEIKVELGDVVDQDEVLIIFENEVEMKAPFRGTIIEVNAADGKEKDEIQVQSQAATPQIPGQAPSAVSTPVKDTALLVIAKLDDLEFVTKIDEDQIEMIKKNHEVRLKCDIDDEVTIYGGISEVGFQLEQDADGSRYYQVNGDINDLKELNPRNGMSCDGEIVLEVKDDVLTVPDDAVMFEDSRTYVYVYDSVNETVTKEKIEIGIEGRDIYEVTEGLEEEDEVIENAEGYDYK